MTVLSLNDLNPWTSKRLTRIDKAPSLFCLGAVTDIQKMSVF
jgi:hypothetical protein